MVTKNDILLFLAANKEKFADDLRIVRLGLFGSFAQDAQHEASDIDLLVEFEPNTKDLFEKKAALKAALADRFGLEVDVCREKYIKPYFREQILNSAIYV